MDFKAAIKKGQPKTAPRMVLIGEEGVGKSSFAADAPAPVFICAENGLVGSAFTQTENFNPANWESVKQFAKWLQTEKHSFKTLVIDTLDWLEPMLFSFICARDNQKSVEGYGYGKGYNVAADEARLFMAELERLNKSGMGIIIISHCQIKTFNNPLGDNYDRYEAKVSKQIAGLFKEWADVVLFARFKIYTAKESVKSKAKGVGDAVRVIQTTKNPAWDAKNRYSLPDELPLDYSAVMVAIENERPDTDEAIEKEIKELIEQSPMVEERKVSARSALSRDKGNSNKLKVLLNRVREAA